MEGYGQAEIGMEKYVKGMVSIVCPTHGFRNLEPLKNSIENSLYKNFELIIVNRNQERSLQRNYGIDQAKGEFLLWLDSDQGISSFLLNECVSMMQKGYDALYIPEKIVANSFFGRIRAFERTFYTGTPIDCVRFLRLVNCPRFDTELHGPEDSDFDRRVSGKRGITRAFLYHYDDIKPHEYFLKKAYYAKSLSKYLEKNPGDKCLDPVYRCFTVFVENGKWKNICLHPVLSIGIIFIIFVRGLIYVTKR